MVARAQVSHLRPLGLLFLCLVFVLVLAAPVVSQDDDVAADKQLSLQIDAPKGEFAPGDEALVTLTATNSGGIVVETVTLQLHDQPGLEWSEDFKETWLELGELPPGESRVIEGRIRVTGLPANGLLSLFATLHGYDTPLAEAGAQLTVPPPPPEEVTVAKQGSLVDAAGGRVQFAFPADWHESDARLTFQLQEQLPQAAGETGRLLLFSVEATAGDSAVDSFDAAATVTVDLNGLVDAAWAAERPPVVSTRETEKEDWTAVESTFDPKTGLLTFATAHFSSYQVTTEPEPWQLLYNPPGASAYTGAATYRYPIELPPGIGGLTPELSLNYNSRPVDSMRAPVMSFGFGAGWSFPQAQINNGNSSRMYSPIGGSADYASYRFTLLLNGITYHLQPVNNSVRYGAFRAIGGPELLIEFIADGSGRNDTNNVSGEFWRVTTPDGTAYTFGRTMDSEQVVYPVAAGHNGGQLRNRAFSPYNWKLDLIQDVHGNKIEYSYTSAPGIGSGRKGGLGSEHNYADQSTEVDTVLSEIRYNFSGGTPQTSVLFTYEEDMNGTAVEEITSMTAGYYRPTRIDVKQNNAVLRSYSFTYHPVGFHFIASWAGSSQFWMLKSISQIGAGGVGALPTQTFTYNLIPYKGCAAGDNQGETNYCVQTLEKVENGYGAVTVFSYTKLNSKWMHVTTVDTWDGVAAKYPSSSRPQTRTAYDRTGATTCFDSEGSPCHLAPMPPSDSLVGFSGVTILTQDGGWTTLVKQVLTFKNDNYWLLGKELTRSTQTAAGVELSSDSYTWQEVGGDDQLKSEIHTQGNRAGDFMSRETKYYYDDAAYGALIKKEEYEKRNTTTTALYRCTQYAYAHLTTGTNWLVNRPTDETLFAGACGGTKMAETRYRYANSADPDDTTLDPRALLTYVLQLRNTSTNLYATEKRTYTAQGLPDQSITFGSGSTLTAYATDALNTTTTAYNGLGLPTGVTTTATGLTTQTTTIAYDTTFPWLPAKVTDSNSVYTQYGYDTFGRLNRVAMPGDALTDATIRYQYYDSGSPVFLSPLLVGTFYKGSIKADERALYDGLGRLVQTQTGKAQVQGSGQKDVITSYGYDARGLEVCRTVAYMVDPYTYNPNNPLTPFQGTACTAKDNTATAYDALGRPTKVTGPDSVETEMSYGVANNITVEGRKLLYRTSVYDGNDHLVNRFSDAFGRQVLVREFTGASTATYAAYADTRYSYDVLGNLTAVGTSAPSDNPPVTFLRLTEMSYDAVGRKLTMDDPDAGYWAYIYEGAGNLFRQENKTGATVKQATCYYYDKLNRPIRRINVSTPADPCPLLADAPVAGAHHLASYTYDTATKGVGKPATVSWGPIPTQNNDAFTYDGEGRPAKQTRLVNGQEFAYEVVTYDMLDRPTQIKLYTGTAWQTANYTYDKEGQNTLSAGGTQLISDVGYNERGQLAFLERTGNAPDTTLSYHDATENFRLSAIANSGSSSFPDFTYTGYDAAGNLTAMAITDNSGLDPNCNNASECSTFSYDAMNRLLTAELLGAGAANYDYTYTYNELGNLMSREAPDPNWSMSYTYGPVGGAPAVTDGPQALTQSINGNGTVVRYDYDERGNMDGRYVGAGLVHNYVFDKENRLTSVTTNTQTMSFAYDADGQRVMTTRHDGTILYTPFPDYEVEDPPTGQNTTRTTYRIAGQMVAVQVKVGAAAGVFSYTLTDHLGNVVALSTTGGALVANSLARFDPFGNYRTLPSTNPGTTNHGFTGHRHNNTGAYPTLNVGLIYMNARYYLPEVGRFISADTIVPEPGNPQSYNRYSYALNSPTNLIDPSGHRPIGECGAYENCQPTSNPWKQTEDMLDTNRDGIASEQEIDGGMAELEQNGADTLLSNSLPPVDSSLNPFGGPMTVNNCGIAGRPSCDARHPGVDSSTGAINRDDLIYAIAYGTVVAVGYADDGFGNYVIIEHNVYGVLYYSVYAHNSFIYVAKGDIVTAGAAIARMGDTHNQAVVHSHFEMRTPSNLSLDEANPFSGHVYWPSSGSILRANFVDLGPMYGYHSTYFGWLQENP